MIERNAEQIWPDPPNPNSVSRAICVASLEILPSGQKRLIGGQIVFELLSGHDALGQPIWRQDDKLFDITQFREIGQWQFIKNDLIDKALAHFNKVSSLIKDNSCLGLHSNLLMESAFNTEEPNPFAHTLPDISITVDWVEDEGEGCLNPRRRFIFSRRITSGSVATAGQLSSLRRCNTAWEAENPSKALYSNMLHSDTWKNLKENVLGKILVEGFSLELPTDHSQQKVTPIEDIDQHGDKRLIIWQETGNPSHSIPVFNSRRAVIEPDAEDSKDSESARIYFQIASGFIPGTNKIKWIDDNRNYLTSTSYQNQHHWESLYIVCSRVREFLTPSNQNVPV